MCILPLTKCNRLKTWLCRLHGMHIGKNICLCGGTKFYGSSNISIGDNCHIGVGCVFFATASAKIQLANDVALAPNVTLHTGSHHIGPYSRRAGVGFSSDITIHSGTWVCMNSTITAGTILPSGSVISANSLCRPINYQSNCIYGGVPAKFIRFL